MRFPRNKAGNVAVRGVCPEIGSKSALRPSFRIVLADVFSTRGPAGVVKRRCARLGSTTLDELASTSPKNVAVRGVCGQSDVSSVLFAIFWRSPLRSSRGSSRRLPGLSRDSPGSLPGVSRGVSRETLPETLPEALPETLPTLPGVSWTLPGVSRGVSRRLSRRLSRGTHLLD